MQTLELNNLWGVKYKFRVENKWPITPKMSSISDQYVFSDFWKSDKLELTRAL